MSGLYLRFQVSRFAIRANDKCIACGECTRNRQVGIDVMSFALEQRVPRWIRDHSRHWSR